MTIDSISLDGNKDALMFQDPGGFAVLLALKSSLLNFILWTAKVFNMSSRHSSVIQHLWSPYTVLLCRSWLQGSLFVHSAFNTQGPTEWPHVLRNCPPPHPVSSDSLTKLTPIPCVHITLTQSQFYISHIQIFQDIHFQVLNSSLDYQPLYLGE